MLNTWKSFMSFTMIYHSYQNKFNLYDKKICFTHKKSEASTKPWINIRVVSLNPKTWLKPYIDINTKLRTEAKNAFGKDFVDSKDSFINHTKTKDVYEDIVDNVEKGFDNSNYLIERSIPKGQKRMTNEMMYWWMKY